ncbi:uncharacterized protein K02A2.6-like [Ruditapes philippinarum]|uniref:uncharacterized protein K02A2.6-like n=1 Tax=Ruditapes philippinarum TaxID=129788 RepID=UPI00295B17F1|nr:uncharacterized protein K02A2.6-like [Ruditapes philippinarum]
MTKAPVLAYYDPKKPVTLQVDSSARGLGCTCLQDGKPIAFASKNLTPTERGYAQIEKETLAILHGLRRFKQYCYARHNKVESDSKPVVSVMKKEICRATPRLHVQRLLLQIQQFDIEVVHFSGKSIPVADTLSRHFVKDTYPELSDGLDVHVHTVINSLPVSDGKLQDLRLSTQQDSQFQTLKQTIIDGWPESRHECPNSILEFWNHRDELSTVNDIIFRSQTLVIPSSLRTEMINAVYVGHMVVNKTLNRAKDIMFWPDMVKQVTNHVLACPLCLTHRASNVKESINPHIVPKRPWQHIAADLFTLDGRDYLITADVYSNYFEVDALPETKSKTVIRKLTMHMARYGQVETLKSNNGPLLSSEEFQKFASDWNFKYVTSSPGYSRSNGFIEKMVSIAKKSMKKCHETKTDPYLAFLEYRNTPLNCGYSPAQLLMGRRLKSILPTTNEQLKPSFINYKSVKKSLQENKVTQKELLR